MTPSKQKRARPTIEPIKTSAIGLHGLPRHVLTPSRCSQCAPSPRSSRIWLDNASPLGSTAEAKFDPSNSASANHCLPRLAPDSAKFGLSPPLPPPSSMLPVSKGHDRLIARAQERPENPSAVQSPTTLTVGSCCARCGGAQGYYHHASLLTARPMTMAEFQRYREMLWRNGQEQFGKASHDAYFVVAEEMEPPPAAGTATGPSAAQSSMADENRYPFRAVIRSGDGSMKLKRDFDMRVLRATIPEPIPSPCSPNFDRSSLLAPFAPDAGLPSPPRTAVYTGPVTRGARAKRLKLESRAPHSPKERPQGAGPRPYARAHLPVLAAIMLSDLVRSGSTIQLPMPHPKAWAETAGYVYTGEEQLLSEKVKANIRHLGGKV